MRLDTKELKRAWEENPLLVITIAAGAVGAVAKFIDALGSYQSRRAYSRRGW